MLEFIVNDLTSHERNLLEGWEDVHKKGQLSLWILLALKDRPRHMAEIKQFVQESTNGLMTADDKSLYRALRRFYDADMIDYRQVPSENGPELKLYRLTESGINVLQRFIKRNITNVYFKDTNVSLFAD